MKRYVKELANDKIKSLDGMDEYIKQKNIEYINKTVRLCERNFITDFEAVKMILLTQT